jgi:sugar transferase EpsL
MSSFYRCFGKRFVDVVLSACALTVTLPVFVATSIAIRVALGPRIFFTQRRPGLGAKPFDLAKFRTMRAESRRNGVVLRDAERMTRFGQILRSSSVDELPELWNVLKGEMSLVGPRPLLMQYLDRYTPEQARRHNVKPGITGWAQVNGRNAISWEQKFRLDVWYVDNCSFALDMKILALTVWQVIARRGINQPGHATAEEFMGTSH